LRTEGAAGLELRYIWRHADATEVRRKGTTVPLANGVDPLTKNQSETLAVLVVIGLIFGAIVKFFEAVGFVVPITIATIAAALVMFVRASRRLLVAPEKQPPSTHCWGALLSGRSA
jgi:hypothetical protein